MDKIVESIKTSFYDSCNRNDESITKWVDRCKVGWLEFLFEVLFWFKYSGLGDVDKLNVADRFRAMVQGVVLGGIGSFGFAVIIHFVSVPVWIFLVFCAYGCVLLGLMMGSLFSGDDEGFEFLRNGVRLARFPVLIFIHVFVVPVLAVFVWFWFVNGGYPEEGWWALVAGFVLLGMTIVGDDFFRFVRLGNNAFERWRTVFTFCFVVFAVSFGLVDIPVVDEVPLEVSEFDGFTVESFCRGDDAFVRFVSGGGLIEFVERDPLSDSDCVGLPE